MKTVFISQPMRGKTNDEILAERNACIEWYKQHFVKDGEAFQVSESYFKDFDGNRLQFLGKSIMDCLSKADIAIFVGDWENYDGCSCEHYIAQRYKIPVEYYRPSAQYQIGANKLDFGQALHLCIDQGVRIARKGWNSQNQYVVYQQGTQIEDPKLARNRWLEREVSSASAPVTIMGHLDIVQHLNDGTVRAQVGWLASQSDMQADDWYVWNEGGVK